jgi:membrane protease YdiL (CAAX protease family)
MDASTSSLASAATQRQARRGLTIYLAVVVVISALFEGITISTGVLVWLVPVMWTPAAASVVARLVLREGFADVSFRFGGRRTFKMILLALVFPIIIGLVAYGIAWATGLAQFDPKPGSGGWLYGSFVGDTASPATIFVVMIAKAVTIGTILTAVFYTWGEELGWRGYMLTRLIDAGVPRPVLASGLIWGLYHIPVVLAGMYVATPHGSSSVVTAVLFMVQITSNGFVIARMRLETGSIWPAIAQHAAWNSIIPGAFDLATKGAEATLWVGETGILVAITMVVAAVIFSRGHWTIRRVPEVQQGEVAASPASHR